MDIFTQYYLTALTICALGWGVAALVALILWNMERTRALRRNDAIEEIASIVGNDAPPHYTLLDALRNRYPLSTLAEAAACVADAVSGSRLYRVAMLAERCGVYDYFRYAAAASTSLRRARHLALLTKFPLTRRYGPYTAGYLDDRSARVRFYAFGIQIIAEAERAIPQLAAFERRLSAHELAELLAMLRRTTCPVVYTPLLRSESANLRMLGITLVGHFGFSDCEQQLCDILRRNDDTAPAALYAMIAIGANISRREVRQLVRQLTPERRRVLCRHLASAGYSLTATSPLLAPDDRQYFEAILNSYKRRIVCS